MGVVYNKYRAMYVEALNKAMNEDLEMVKPEIWMTARWESDTGNYPWNPDFYEKMAELLDVDYEMYKVVSKGFSMFSDDAKESPEQYLKG